VISADNTHKSGGGMLLNCSRSQVYGIQEEMSSTYTTRVSTRGMVIHMLRGREACTNGAVVHKMNAWSRGHKDAHQRTLMCMQMV
jgi:predicted transporter